MSCADALSFNAQSSDSPYLTCFNLFGNGGAGRTDSFAFVRGGRAEGCGETYRRTIRHTLSLRVEEERRSRRRCCLALTFTAALLLFLLETVYILYSHRLVSSTTSSYAS